MSHLRYHLSRMPLLITRTKSPLLGSSDISIRPLFLSPRIPNRDPTPISSVLILNYSIEILSGKASFGQGCLQCCDYGIDILFAYVADVADTKDLAIKPLLSSGEDSIVFLAQDLEKQL